MNIAANVKIAQINLVLRLKGGNADTGGVSEGNVGLNNRVDILQIGWDTDIAKILGAANGESTCSGVGHDIALSGEHVGWCPDGLERKGCSGGGGDWKHYQFDIRQSAMAA